MDSIPSTMGGTNDIGKALSGLFTSGIEALQNGLGEGLSGLIASSIGGKSTEAQRRQNAVTVQTVGTPTNITALLVGAAVIGGVVLTIILVTK